MSQPDRKPYRNYHNSYEEIIKAQLELIRELSKEIVKLSLEMARLKEPVAMPPMQRSPVPLKVPESEEDAKFMLETGQIDKSEYKSVLRELQFFNDEIVVPEG